MTLQLAEPADPLAPVRSALLDRARRDVDRSLTGAAREAEALMARARQEAEALLADAREQGAADAQAVLGAARSRARRRARDVVLAAQRAAFDGLRAAALADLPRLRADPAYGPWLERQRARVRTTLGPEAVLVEDPDGGIVGTVAGRRGASTLAALVDRAVDALGPDVEGLWSP